MDYEHILVEAEDGVGIVTLNRPDKLNAMNRKLSGELRDGKSAVDVLRATFPAGTVSGAPKVRAMEIIDELEPCRRGQEVQTKCSPRNSPFRLRQRWECRAPVRNAFRRQSRERAECRPAPAEGP